MVHAHQEFKKSSNMVAALIITGDVVSNPNAYQEDRKGYYSDISKQLAQLGLTKPDLPAPLRERLDNWLATGNPNESLTVAKPEEEQESKPEKKRKGKGDKSEPPAKRAAKANPQRKRKQG